ncbi:MAG: hypothetical protein AAF543_11560 [Pseudomonadota bacterium]
MDYFIFSLSLLLVYLGLALLLHVQFGLLGIPNFGVVGFWGLGMYAMGVLQTQLDLSFIDALAITLAVVALFSYGIGWLILRLDGQGILCATIAFSVIVATLVVTEKWMTMGVVGLGTIRYPVRIGGGTELLYFAFLLAIVAAMQIYVLRLHRSTTGRLLIAIRDNEELAASVGKDTHQIKTFWFTVTCTLMGLLGAFSAPLNQFLTPNMIVPSVTFAVWIALVLGGKEHALGAVIGVFITFGLFDILIETYAPVSPELAIYVPNVKLFVYGALLVAILMFKPSGVLEPSLPPERVFDTTLRFARRGTVVGASALVAALEPIMKRLAAHSEKSAQPDQPQALPSPSAELPPTELPTTERKDGSP